MGNSSSDIDNHDGSVENATEIERALKRVHISTQTIGPPTYMKIDENLSSNWKKWKQSFEEYLKEICIDQNDNYACALFLQYIGQYGQDLFNTFELHKPYTLLNIFTKFEAHYNPKADLLSKRLLFFRTKQKVNQSFEDFFDIVYQRGSTCKFDNLPKMLLHQVIAGIRDARLREIFLEMQESTLRDVRKNCKASELDEEKVHIENAVVAPNISATTTLDHAALDMIEKIKIPLDDNSIKEQVNAVNNKDINLQFNFKKSQCELNQGACEITTDVVTSVQVTENFEALLSEPLQLGKELNVQLMPTQKLHGTSFLGKDKVPQLRYDCERFDTTTKSTSGFISGAARFIRECEVNGTDVKASLQLYTGKRTKYQTNATNMPNNDCGAQLNHDKSESNFSNNFLGDNSSVIKNCSLPKNTPKMHDNSENNSDCNLVDSNMQGFKLQQQQNVEVIVQPELQRQSMVNHSAKRIDVQNKENRMLEPTYYPYENDSSNEGSILLDVQKSDLQQPQDVAIQELPQHPRRNRNHKRKNNLKLPNNTDCMLNSNSQQQKKIPSLMSLNLDPATNIRKKTSHGYSDSGAGSNLSDVQGFECQQQQDEQAPAQTDLPQHRRRNRNRNSGCNLKFANNAEDCMINYSNNEQLKGSPSFMSLKLNHSSDIRKKTAHRYSDSGATLDVHKFEFQQLQDEQAPIKTNIPQHRTRNRNRNSGNNLKSANNGDDSMINYSNNQELKKIPSSIPSLDCGRVSNIRNKTKYGNSSVSVSASNILDVPRSEFQQLQNEDILVNTGVPQHRRRNRNRQYRNDLKPHNNQQL